MRPAVLATFLVLACGSQGLLLRIPDAVVKRGTSPGAFIEVPVDPKTAFTYGGGRGAKAYPWGLYSGYRNSVSANPCSLMCRDVTFVLVHTG